jgi:WS/DGAT/MGAT family acyltransferase
MKPLSSDDAFFLYAETEEQHQHTLGLLILDPSTARKPKKVTVKRLAKKMKKDIHVLPEFRQKLANLPMALAPPVLIDDPDFDVDDHIQVKTLKSPGSLKQLSEIISRFAGEPLDKSKPLWETMFIEGLKGGKIAICSKSHHLIADGVQGAEFMATQFDFEPHPPKKKKRKLAKWSPQEQSALDILGASWTKYREEQPGFRTMLDKTVKSFRARKSLFEKNKHYEDLVTPMIPTAPTLKFNGAITGNRTIALGSIPMATLKAIKNYHNVTINDVLLTGCTLSLRDYLIKTDDLPDEPLICAVPVSLKLKGQESGGSNAVGNMIVKLPVQTGDPKQCLQEVHEYTQASKDIFDESFENLMMGYLGMMPPGVANAAMKAMFSRRLMDRLPTQMNLCVSNFPGPPIPLYMEGAELLGTYPIVTAWVDKLAAAIEPASTAKPVTKKKTDKPKKSAAKKKTAASKSAAKPKVSAKKKSAAAKKPVTPGRAAATRAPIKRKAAAKPKAAAKKKIAPAVRPKVATKKKISPTVKPKTPTRIRSTARKVVKPKNR